MSQLLVNLAFVSNKPTGITTYASNLIPHLEKLQPTLLSARPIEDSACYPVAPNLTPDEGSKGHFRRLRWTQFQLPQIYKQLRSHLLFSPIPEAPLFTNCRYIVTVHDLIPLRFAKKSPLTLYSRYYVPQVLAQAQHIICNSTATAQDITRFFGVAASKITPILLAHDEQHFRWLDLPKQNYFLYIGRQDPYKNLQRTIAAFATIPNCRDYQLWLAGSFDSRYTPTLKALIDNLGITEQVKFLDYVPYSQLPVIINGAIALVFPSLWEGFGFPVLEAMACGTPVITSNISSLPEVAGNAALLVDPYNTEEISAAMQEIANSEQMRSHLRELGLTRASEFSWEKTGQATVKVLSQYL
ncbi:glycosyltransferase family 4 protein [Aliterella atlantica]|uniref:Mannosyltransferase n=1 Tax=Aliterella atlantica CENA595 TaxID=1618023 RepID=A0A0D8ZTS8_9CYAN|nr:glycosyltransferase family 1 protein [Aliterella atlantica]KJH70656.1 mannosyltransferase [Aliterella atlantica CENA595]